MSEYVLVFWTAANLEEAKRVASGLLAEGYIACASIIPQVISIFRWQGKLEEASEAKVIFKTKKQMFLPIEAYIKKNVIYEVPEVLLVAIAKGSEPYLEWIESCLDDSKGS